MNRAKNFLLYCGITKEEYDLIRTTLWVRNIRALKVTALLAGGIGVLFLLINLITQSGVVLPYVFLLAGSMAVILLLKVGKIKNHIKGFWPLVMCYAQMILVCIYAGILSTQPSNFDTPATSIIVFITILPLGIDDRPIRMYSFMLAETAGYLVTSYLLKSPHAFGLDIQNAATFCVVGMVVYGIICARNVREIHQSARVERIQKSIISSLANVVEARDESTGDHIQRTQDYVSKLLHNMITHEEYANLSKEYCDNVVMAAPMHDIGKIEISDTILNKPGKLTEEEFEIMKKHSEYGGDIIKDTISNVEEQEYCSIAYNIARYHHERYDGKGYPDNLKGEEIPLEARIMALADVYDALVSERVYKKAFSKETAIKIIQEGKGTQFDPNLVPLFLECVTENEKF